MAKLVERGANSQIRNFKPKFKDEAEGCCSQTLFLRPGNPSQNNPNPFDQPSSELKQTSRSAKYSVLSLHMRDFGESYILWASAGLSM